MKKVILIFGTVAGLILALTMHVGMSYMEGDIDFKNGELIGYSSMIVAFSTIFFGIRSYRNKSLNGAISFGKAFQIGLLITLIASCFYVTSWMIFSHNHPEFMDQYFEMAVNEVRESGISETEIEEKVQEMNEFKEMYKKPFVKIGFTFLEIIPVGLVIALIAAAVLKKKEPSTT